MMSINYSVRTSHTAENELVSQPSCFSSQVTAARHQEEDSVTDWDLHLSSQRRTKDVFTFSGECKSPHHSR